ncbi:MAG TPA: bifunctional phosphopantothenoylcysteine decarboxylase/phosphopantothenate--cysteine ligase CoaBC [Pyrinomonadaceae bacterium]|jgi:phosphopantothenoylcysteine decarboxylase/phosphopantothenate--cysteine ligase|nr:bifunctional phosphopantothenoylcysteine decarboxylase/phosphopantothenate--cysteine ligase CoaBC [Pyrinomonadaceae bacterium]
MYSPESQASSFDKNVALGVCGGIAAYKAVEVLRGLQKTGCTVRVAMTKRACEFVQPLTFRALSGHHVIVDDYAPDNPDPIAHITFSQTVDLLVVAPATANIIAKFANGVADDFLSSTYLACTAPVLIAPAMNTTMWEHPATQRNLERLRADGVHFVAPDAGEMACGTIGPGRLSEPERIVAAALEILGSSESAYPRDLSGEKLLITVGATREEIDPVRFISNRSSGRMGFALAEAALKRGAEVTVVSGVTTATPPDGVRIVKALSAEDMSQAVARESAGASVFIGAAAIADYRPAQRADQKIKKTNDSITLTLERTPDVLSQVAASRSNGMLVIGFAAETENVVENAREKLHAKKLDAIIANDVTRGDSGFDSATNVITIITKDDNPIALPVLSKRDAADRVLDVIVQLRSR